MLGLRLHPAGAYALLSLPMREVSGLTVDLHDLVGAAASELAERCHDAVLGRALLRRSPPTGWRSGSRARARSIRASRGASAASRRAAAQVPIAEIRDGTGLSKTRLAGMFREQIGVLPKVYARIVRFRRALALLDRESASLADVALEAGYYDQSHMTTEFRELGGPRPRASSSPCATPAARPPSSTERGTRLFSKTRRRARSRLGRERRSSMAVHHVPRGHSAVSPYLVTANAEQVILLMKQALGGEELHRSIAARRQHHARRGQDRRLGGHARPRPRADFPAMPCMIHVYVPDCDAAYARALQLGATSLRAPASQFYGDRSGGVRDAGGNQWWIATHEEDVAPDEIERRARAAAQG